LFSRIKEELSTNVDIFILSLPNLAAEADLKKSRFSLVVLTIRVYALFTPANIKV